MDKPKEDFRLHFGEDFPISEGTLEEDGLKSVKMYTLQEIQIALERLKKAGYDLNQGSVLENFTVRELIDFSQKH
jgi:hypothetical protein